MEHHEKLSYFKEFAQKDRTIISDFLQSLKFDIDQFQREAIRSFMSGNSVLVAAPTGSGKTIVGEFALHASLKFGQRSFYTTPIKALSNQKYTDLVERFGSEKVGLLTGDNSINGDAQIVVMTTEVLRNMIYQDPEKIHDLGVVVMDEVHFLADKERGVVWEEILILLNQSVKIVALSATVSNVEDFAEWLNQVRGSCTFVIEEKRPVPLSQVIATSHDLIALVSPDNPGKLNQNVINLYKRNHSHKSKESDVATRPELVELLNKNALLPAIFFIFSRKGCQQAVENLQKTGIKLTSPEERSEIERLIQNRFNDISAADWGTLDIDSWIDAARRGIGSHHAGLIPQLKEITESLFQKGLMKVVFATETLAVGVNMPAKSVVLERMDKWNGDSHEYLTPGEFTQLTGRAGRRGIDNSGVAVIAFHPDSEPRFLLNLVSSRTFEINSRFTPKYNMLLNLSEHRSITATKTLLNKSFAQFVHEKSSKRLRTRITEEKAALKSYSKNLVCDKGNFESYYSMIKQLTDREREESNNKKRRNTLAGNNLAYLIKVGSVVRLRISGKFLSGVVTKVNRERRGSDTYWIVLENQDSRKFRINEIDAKMGIVSELIINRTTDFSKRENRKYVSEALKNIEIINKVDKNNLDHKFNIDELRSKIRKHESHKCNDLHEHLRWAEKKDKLQKSVLSLELGYNTSVMSLSNKCDEILRLLTEIDYIGIKDDQVILQNKSFILKEIHSEQDLLISETIVRGILDDCDSDELPAILSSFIYQPRRDEYEIPNNLSSKIRDKAKDITALANQLVATEVKYKIEYVKTPHFGIAEQMKKWAQGESLQKILRNSDLAAGDFVRNAKQITDLLRQISRLKIDKVSKAASESVAKINRGVVAYEPTIYEEDLEEANSFI